LLIELQDKAWAVRYEAVHILGKNNALPDEAILALTDMLRYEDDEHVRWNIVKTLAAQKELSHHSFNALAKALQDKEPIRSAVLDIFERFKVLSEDTILTVIDRLEDEPTHIRRIVGLIEQQETLSDNVLLALLVKFQHKDWLVRCAAAKILISASQNKKHDIQSKIPSVLSQFQILFEDPQKLKVENALALRDAFLSVKQ
jgi:HEAT repeat protein